MANPYDDSLPGEEEKPPETEQHNAASPRGRQAKAARIRDERAEAYRFWNAVMRDRIGRREIWRLVNDAGVFKQTFSCGPNGFPQPEASWFQAGVKDFGERFYRMLAREHRALVLTMHDEHDPAFTEIREFVEKMGDAA